MENPSQSSLNEQVLERMKALYAAGEIRPIFARRTPESYRSDYARDVGEVKRFLERWSADDAFRAVAERDPVGAARSLGLSIDAIGLRPLWDREVAYATPADQLPLSFYRYRAFFVEKVRMRDEMRATTDSADPRYARWRERQMRRAGSQLEGGQNDQIIHAPFCIELTQGCSVGCWFCGISAPKLGDLFLHTPENQALYIGVVDTLKEIFQAGAGKGFNYWATDPIDNPDYEKFMVDFHDRTGVFPQTTTALALKDVERTRRLLELSHEKGGQCDRFSLLTLKQLLRVHQSFTPEELLYVEMVLQNQENTAPKVNAGRAVDGKERKVNPGQHGNELRGGTIACVSGFLINMVNRTVKLISPCEADERWPLGYIIFDDARFADVAQFRDAVERMIDTHMTPTPRLEDPVAFFDYLQYQKRGNGFQLSSPSQSVQFHSHPAFAAIGKLLGTDPKQLTVEQLLDLLSEREEVDTASAIHALTLLYEQGVLDTVPRRPATDLVQVRR